MSKMKRRPCQKPACCAAALAALLSLWPLSDSSGAGSDRRRRKAPRGARISAPSRRPSCLPPIAPARAATRARRGSAKRPVSGQPRGLPARALHQQPRKRRGAGRLSFEYPERRRPRRRARRGRASPRPRQPRPRLLCRTGARAPRQNRHRAKCARRARSPAAGPPVRPRGLTRIRPPPPPAPPVAAPPAAESASSGTSTARPSAGRHSRGAGSAALAGAGGGARSTAPAATTAPKQFDIFD